MTTSNAFKQHLPVVAAAVRGIILFITVLSIPLASAQALGLSLEQTTGWVMALLGVPAVLGLILSFLYRQPLLLTGNLFVIIFINGLGDRYAYAELIGAAMLAGVLVLLVGLLGISRRLASLIPVPIMFGLLAGAVMPFISNFFTSMGDFPILVGGTLLVYLLSRGFLGERLPAILLALVMGVVLAALTGQFGTSERSLAFVMPALTLPVFSLPVILTATPVFFVLITLQANLPSLRFLHSQGYHPPERVIDTVSGLGTILGSLLGPTGMSLSLPIASLTAGPDSGEQAIRHRAVYIIGIAAGLTAFFGGVAALLAGIIPRALLLTLAGLAVVDVLVNALQQMAHGPLKIGPMFAFAIGLSKITFLGFDNYFWALVIGTLVSILLEREGLLELSRQKSAPER
jgi:benzoate membrane transport protein